MFKKVAYSLAIILVCYLAQPMMPQASATVWSDAYGSACQIRGAAGFVVGEGSKDYFIMTAGHVVREDDSVHKKIWGYFHSSGKRSPVFWPTHIWSINKTNIDTGLYDDLAILSISKEWFIRNRVRAPHVLRLLDRRARVVVNTPFITFGAPGQWLTGYSGQVFNAEHRNFFIVNPTPLVGRSGSAIVNYDSNVIGIVLNTNGACISSNRIYDLLGVAKLGNSKWAK